MTCKGTHGTSPTIGSLYCVQCFPRYVLKRVVEHILLALWKPVKVGCIAYVPYTLEIH